MKCVKCEDVDIFSLKYYYCDKCFNCSYCNEQLELEKCNQDYCENLICKKCREISLCKTCNRTDCKECTTSKLCIIKHLFVSEIYKILKEFEDEYKCYACKYYFARS